MSKYRIPLYQVHMPNDSDKDLMQCLHNGKISRGPVVETFEEMFQKYIGNPLTFASAHSSTSLALALFMAGVRPGDEVLASPMACLATNIPILNLFAHPKWCDVDPKSGNISVQDLEKQISPSTKAILIYHWAGNPVHLTRIQEIAHRYQLPIVEDAGEALGATFNGKKIGNNGIDFTIFSFNPTRHMTTVEGAAISFKEEQSYLRGKDLKYYGIHEPSFRDAREEINPQSDVIEPGYFNEMNSFAATLGVAQISHLPKIVQRHQKNGLFYRQSLQGIAGLTLLELLPTSESAYWVYSFLAEKRDDLFKKLKDHGIHASQVHLRNDIYSCFKSSKRELPGVDFFNQHQLSIPCGWWLSDEDREYIVSSIKAGW